MVGFAMILVHIFPIVLIIFMVIFLGLTDNVKYEKNNQEDTSKSKKRIKILISGFAVYIVSCVAMWYIYREEVGITYMAYSIIPYFIAMFTILAIINAVSLIIAKVKGDDTEAYMYRLIVFSSLIFLTYAFSKILVTLAAKPIPMM